MADKKLLRGFLVAKLRRYAPEWRISMYLNRTLNNRILILLTLLIIFCFPANTHLTEFNDVHSVTENLQNHRHTSHPLIPPVCRINSEIGESTTGSISTMPLRDVLQTIFRSRRYRHINSVPESLAGTLMIADFGFFEKKLIASQNFDIAHPFLLQIIQYIHHQDGKKDTFSPIRK